MSTSIDIRTGRHCVFNMHVHLVFVTKYRRTVFNKNMIHFMQTVFSDVCQKFEAELIEFDGELDHVHLLVHYAPKISISKLVNSLKGVSSRLLRKEFADIHKFYWKGVLWSPSYFAGSCGGAPVTIIKQYIQHPGLWFAYGETPYFPFLKEGVFRRGLINNELLVRESKLLIFAISRKNPVGLLGLHNNIGYSGNSSTTLKRSL